MLTTTVLDVFLVLTYSVVFLLWLLAILENDVCLVTYRLTEKCIQFPFCMGLSSCKTPNP